MNKYSLLFLGLIISACSDISEQEKEFVKSCYYGSNTQISKNICSCIYKDLMNTYSNQEMSKVLRDDYPEEQLYAVKNKLRDLTLKSYQKCK